MIVGIGAAATVWFGARALGAPRWGGWLGVAAVYGAILGAKVVLPPQALLHDVIGGDLRSWLGLGVAVLAVLAYRAGLGWLRARAAPAPVAETNQDGPFSDAEIERYARHIVLREIGGVGQKRLKDAKVLVVGAGGLGSPALLYLAGAGVGTIGVIDDDTVALSNLARQVIHTDERSDMPKVFSAEIAMRALNSHVQVRPYNRKLDEDTAADLIADYDLVLDGTDNFATRALVNRACVATGTPLISGAITQWEGQLSLFDPSKGGPCYACLFPSEPADGLAPSCAEGGVAAPLPGVIGTMMALEAVKHITGAGTSLLGRLMLYDALSVETRVMKVKRDATCSVCKDV